MTTLIMQHQAGLGLVGWIVVFTAFFFLKDLIFKKKKSNDDNGQSKE